MADLTVAVITGRRPDLLATTLHSFAAQNPDLWNTAVRVAVHNGGPDDCETAETLDSFRWDVRHRVNGPLLGIGAASAVLAEQVRHAPPTALLLRLEDDWECVRQHWFADAASILNDPTVGQVRLRKAAEPVMRNDRLTGRPIRWRQYRDTGHHVALAHYTHQPSLMRTEDWHALFPYRNEVDAARRFRRSALRTVQHRPGVFKHLADRTRSLKWNGGSA